MTMTVFVMDGSDLWRGRLIVDLERHFGTVKGARTGEDGLRCLRAEPFDAVTLDLSLPDVSGMELIPILRRHHPLLRIVVVTGVASVASSVRAIKLGAADYLIKPVPAVRVAAALCGHSVHTSGQLVPEMSLDRLAWEHVHRVLDDSNGNISEAARRLRMHRQSLQRMLRKIPRLHEQDRLDSGSGVD
jgi:two-component system response regulator RegA